MSNGSIFDVNSEVDFIGERDVIIAESNEPQYGSKQWHEYIMSRFDPEELFDGNPTCAGLRRVVEDVLGSIVSSGPSEVFVFPPANENGPGRATVVYEVIIDWKNSGNYRTYKEVADVWHGNTDDLFAAHPAATASTRAEGRALRKALKVRCLAAEELAKKDVAAMVRNSVSVKVEAPTNGEMKQNERITMAQLNFLDKKCSQLNIDVVKFLESENVNLNLASKQDGMKVLDRLNQHQTGQSKLLADVYGYKNDWRKV